MAVCEMCGKILENNRAYIVSFEWSDAKGYGGNNGDHFVCLDCYLELVAKMKNVNFFMPIKYCGKEIESDVAKIRGGYNFED